MKFEIPIKTVSVANATEHWRTRAGRVKRERRATALVGRALVGRYPVDRALQVRLVRISPGTLDDDNLRPALKAIRDELAVLLGRKDDSERAGVSWLYGQRKERRYAVEVCVELHGEGDAAPGE